MQGEDIRGRIGGDFTYEPFSESADPRAIEDAYRFAGRQLSPALAASYVDKLAGPNPDEDALLDARISVAATALVPQIVAEVEEAADGQAREWLALTRVARKSLSDERQAEYERLEGMSRRPERVGLVAPNVAQADTRVRDAQGNETPLPTRRLHILGAEDGTVPVDLNTWELRGLDTRVGAAQLWRVVPRSLSDFQRVTGCRVHRLIWRLEGSAMRPDFVFFFSITSGGDVAVDLVDPHGHHFADAVPQAPRPCQLRGALWG